jgi:hypothetical protein
MLQYRLACVVLTAAYMQSTSTSADWPVLRSGHLLCYYWQVWATYSPVKNSPADARIKAAEGNPTHRCGIIGLLLVNAWPHPLVVEKPVPSFVSDC